MKFISAHNVNACTLWLGCAAQCASKRFHTIQTLQPNTRTLMKDEMNYCKRKKKRYKKQFCFVFVHSFAFSMRGWKCSRSAFATALSRILLCKFSVMIFRFLVSLSRCLSALLRSHRVCVFFSYVCLALPRPDPIMLVNISRSFFFLLLNDDVGRASNLWRLERADNCFRI